MKHVNIVLFCIAVFLLQVRAVAQKEKPAPAAPVPAQIVVAKKVFVANAGSDEWAYSDGPFHGARDRAYDQFYAALKDSGRYELVTAPADADLLFEIEFSVPSATSQVDRSVVQGFLPEPFDPRFRLVIRDPKTGAVLWALTEHIQWAILQGNRDKNFDHGLAKLVVEVRDLTGQSVAPGEAK